MKEELTKQFLSLIVGDNQPQFPLSLELGVSLSIFLQSFRYLMALYGDKKMFTSSSCSEDFTNYLQVVLKTSSNVYNWPADDVKFLKEFSPRVLELDDPDNVFDMLQSKIQRVLSLTNL